MNTDAWVIRSRRVATPEGLRAATIVVRGEVIAEILPFESAPAGLELRDVGEFTILPGVVDTHVHINEPGRTEWEGFETATRAAAAGGVTTLVDMPLNSTPAVTSPAALAAKRAAATGKLRVDCGFFGGVVPGNTLQLLPLATAGVLGFKAFLCPSGVDDFPGVSEENFRAAATAVLRSGRPLLVHAEVPGPVEGLDPAADPRHYANYLSTRPPEWEHSAIRMLIGICREYRCRVHVVHLASAAALPMIAQARAEGLPLSVETCPHYLTFAAEDIPDADPRFKCAPPIRSAGNREGLWEGLKAGLIDTIGSDHSPAPPSLKQLDTGDFLRAWGGIASLQVALSAVWTEARKREVSLEQVCQWMATKSAALVGLGSRKGAVTPGRDADLVVFDPEASFVVEPDGLYHRHSGTPYAGRTLFGRVETTYLRGRAVYSTGRFLGAPVGQEIIASYEDVSRSTPAGLARLNTMPEADARAALLACCGATRWAREVAALRPFESPADLIEAADRGWAGLGHGERLEAFAAHPRIGDLETRRAKDSTAAAEQSGVAGASDSLLEALAEANRAYEANFGHIFIVCATGKSAEDMLGLLRSRLGNDPETELDAAAAEQAKITRIRLGNLWK